MTPLTKHETVWLQAFIAANTCNLQAANYALEAFKATFPDVSTSTQKESVATLTQEEQRKKDFDAKGGV